ncbi:MAG TPA: hypothetical protein VJR29_07545 [bacterium]|nr:hypothetical protein [bacterium]
MFQGKKVEVVLNTPILIHVPEGDSGKSRTEAVVKIHAQVAAASEAGFQLELGELFNEKQQKVPAPHRAIFLPLHKVDHVFPMA